MPTEKRASILDKFKIKCRLLLTDIVGGWYLKICNPKPQSKEPRLSKKEQEQEYRIKSQLKLVFDNWKDWTFQIHW